MMASYVHSYFSFPLQSKPDCYYSNCIFRKPNDSRRFIFIQVDRENGVYSNLIKASVDVLIYQDEAGYAAATASLATLEASVKVTFPSKPPQSVVNIVTLYQHASAIKQAFDQVGERLA